MQDRPTPDELRGMSDQELEARMSRELATDVRSHDRDPDAGETQELQDPFVEEIVRRITDGIDEALAPLVARIEALERAVGIAPPTEPA